MTLPILGKKIDFKVDSGEDTSIMSEEAYNGMRPRPNLKPITTTLLGVGRPLESKGQFMAHTEVKGQLFHFRILVVSAKANNLLSRSVANRLCFINKVDEFEETFDNIGCLNTEPVRIVLRDGAEPCALSVVRRVSVLLQPKVKEELDRLQAAGVIVPITKPTSWCAPMVPVVKKSGNGRICVDLKKLNDEVKRETFILSTIDDVTSKLTGATVFTSIDAASGFYQIPLYEDSQELTTCITPFGRYCFRRLTFGITSPHKIVMRKMPQLFECVEGVLCYMDDVLYFEKD